MIINVFINDSQVRVKFLVLKLLSFTFVDLIEPKIE